MRASIWQIERRTRANGPTPAPWIAQVDLSLGTFGTAESAEAEVKRLNDLAWARFRRRMPADTPVSRETWNAGIGGEVYFQAVPSDVDVPVFVIGEEPNPYDAEFDAPNAPVAIRIDLGAFSAQGAAEEACDRENRAKHESWSSWVRTENARRTAEHQKAQTFAALAGLDAPPAPALWRDDLYDEWLASKDTICLQVYPLKAED